MTRPGTLSPARPRSGKAYVSITLFAPSFQTSSARPSQGRKRRRRTPHLPCLSARDSVWAVPFSLAANNGISIDFSSCWYSDVSFPSVRAPFGAPGRPCGYPGELNPIRKSQDQRLHAPPLGLSQLATSFFATQAKSSTIRRLCIRMSITSRRMLARTLCTA